MRLGPCVLAFALAGCATGPHPLDTSYLATFERCPEESQVSCCQALDRRVHEARARSDDRTADREAERLALACPSLRRDVLRADRGGPGYLRYPGEATAHLSVSYELQLAPEDRLVWAAEYLDEARLGPYSDAGSYRLHVELHVISGSPPTRGKIVRLERIIAVVLKAGYRYPVKIRARRVDRGEPFALEVDAGMAGARGPGPEGTIGLGNLDLGEAPRLRDGATPFQPPTELMDAGAPPIWLDACTDPAGRVKDLMVDREKGAQHVHPRQLGAVLDWARGQSFEARPPGRLGLACPSLNVRFDRTELPPLGRIHRIR